MKPNYILSLDQGTTSSRSIVFDASGAMVAVGQTEFEQHFPQPGWVEHDAMEIWETQIGTARHALAQAGLEASEVAAIGITNQRETVVIWDRATGEPIHKAIVWQDRRTADVTAGLKQAGHQTEVQAKTGLVLDPYFSATKVAWILDHVDGARTRAENGELAFGTIDTWLVYQLTGGRVHATDVSNAGRTSLLNIHTLTWDDDLLDLFKVPRPILPEVVSSSGVIGTTDADLLGAEIPISGIAGDQQAALFGQLCFKEGMAKNTYGTGCFMLLNTGTEPVASTSNLLTTVAWKIGDQPCHYALEGSVFIGGAAIQWLRDGLGMIDAAPEINQRAAEVDDTGGVYLVPAFVGLGAPH
ncbi:MAG: glycerol kinase GlpK, partial [Verrucomicrobiota bacterium]